MVVVLIFAEEVKVYPGYPTAEWKEWQGKSRQKGVQLGSSKLGSLKSESANDARKLYIFLLP